ncbi:MAG: stage II sporulation protein M [Oscillospiraceae bacterium]|nr:stage II sporulation protein M [Oscillospiraceae bacterium]
MSEVMEMRRGSSLRVIRMIKPDPASLSVLFLTICFILGGLLGWLFAERCDPSAQDAFRGYLSDYCLFFEQNDTGISLGMCFLLYYSGVCAVFLFGFSALGILVVPVLSACFGFFSLYTVSCFVLSFGRNGALLAAALTVIRLLFTMPCFFLVACQSLIQSIRIAMLTLGHGKRLPSSGGQYVFIFALCLICLCVGVFCERFLTPVLFRAVINAIEWNL